MFKIKFARLVQWLLPSFLRLPNIALFTLSANKGLRDSYAVFLTYRDSALYRLNHNSQVCYLQGVLNDYFDATLRRIRVIDFTAYGASFFWVDTDTPHIVFMGDDSPVFFYNDDVGIDFTVQIPNGLVSDDYSIARLKSLVNYYKLAGKTYILQWI